MSNSRTLIQLTKNDIDILTFDKWQEKLFKYKSKTVMVKQLCNGYPEYLKHLSGFPINVGTATNPQWIELEPQQALKNLKVAFKSQNPSLFHYMWNINKDNLSKYIQELYNIDEQAKLLYYCISCIRVRSESNSLLQDYLATAVNDLRVIDNCIEKIKLKKIRYTNIQIHILEEHKTLLISQNICVTPMSSSSSEISISDRIEPPASIPIQTTSMLKPLASTEHDLFDGLDLSVLPSIDEKESKIDLRSAPINPDISLAPGSYPFILKVINPARLTAQKVQTFIDNDSHLSGYQKWSSEFKTALPYLSKAEITARWDSADDLLKRYFLRKSILIPKGEVSFHFRIDISECFDHFQACILAKCTDLTSLIWEQNSTELKNYIKYQISIDQKVLLLREVLQSSNNEISDFIKSYIESIKDEKILFKALNIVPFMGLESSYALKLSEFIKGHIDTILGRINGKRKFEDNECNHFQSKLPR